MSVGRHFGLYHSFIATHHVCLVEHSRGYHSTSYKHPTPHEYSQRFPLSRGKKTLGCFVSSAPRFSLTSAHWRVHTHTSLASLAGGSLCAENHPDLTHTPRDVTQSQHFVEKSDQ